MTIHSPADFVAGLWDWAILNGCFGNTGIKPTDMDGFVERNYHGLLLETKRTDAQIPRGQQIMFDHLRQMNISVIVVWGSRNKPEAIKVYTRAKVTEKIPCDLSMLRRLVQRWFDYADRGEQPC